MSVHLRATSSLGLHLAGPSDQGDPWQTRGACRDADPELFFVNGAGRPSQEQERLAQRICRHCPVRRECGEWAVKTHQEYGVWGGMTERQLKAARRRSREKPEKRGRQLQPCGTWAAYQRHKKAGEEPCEECKTAAQEAWRRLKSRKAVAR